MVIATIAQARRPRRAPATPLMASYILRRLAYMVILLVALSVVVFIVIQLPPGDMMTVMLARMEAGGADASLGGEEISAMQKQYGLHLPAHLQYLRWAGNLGPSFVYGRPVTVLLLERLPLTVLLSGITLLFAYVVAIPIGIYSATHQYSLGDYGFTVVGFVGLATPNFLLALILMYLLLTLFGVSPGGLFSGEFEHAPWSFAKFLNGLGHLPLPIIVIGMAGTAAIIRVMLGTLLDELRKQYVITARAKGVSETALTFKYPVRVALNPIISTVGWLLPEIVSGSTIVAIVLSLPTVAPLLFSALLQEDMFLAGSTLMVLAALTIIGTLISDLLLVITDPRIRFERV